MRETSESPSRIKWVHRRAGMALVMVLAIVALLMGLVLALLSMAHQRRDLLLPSARWHRLAS